MMKVKMYGVTMVHSDGSIVKVDDNKNVIYATTCTKLDANKEICIEWAIEKMKEAFEACKFENGMDLMKNTEESLESELKSGEDICIDEGSYNICFEFFSQEVTV